MLRKGAYGLVRGLDRRWLGGYSTKRKSSAKGLLRANMLHRSLVSWRAKNEDFPLSSTQFATH